MALCVLVNIRFQVLFHSPPGVLFTFPSQYCFSIGHLVVFRLRGWSPFLLCGFLVSADTPDPDRPLQRFAYKTLTLFRRASQPVRLRFRRFPSVPTPTLFLTSVWPLPVSLATTPGISFDFSSSPYLDVSVREVPLLNLWIQLSMQDSSSCGFPHSDIRGSKPISGSPRLFAGYHVLLRLQVPRHSPYALFRLNSLFSSLELF